MKLPHWSRLVIGMLVAAVAFATLGPLPMVTASSPEAQAFSASLEPLAGLVQHLPSGSSTWETITNVTLVRTGDQVRTGDNGAARLSTVTGLKVELYPTTLVELKDLAMGEGADSSLKFVLSQTVGTSYMTVDQALKPDDHVQIITPSVTANIRGTKFYTFVSRNGPTAFIGEEKTVEMQTINRQVSKIDPDNIGYVVLNVPKEPPATCTIDFLNRSAKGTVLRDLRTPAGMQVLRDFLTQFLESNVNSKIAAFLFRFLDLPETTDPKAILDAIAKFNKQVLLPDFLTDFRSFLRAYFVFLSSGPLAPETCGNGAKDTGETEQNCAADLMDISSTKDNNLCETEKGESLVNDPADCMPFGALAKACADLVNTTLNAGTPPVVPPAPRRRPTFTPPPATVPPVQAPPPPPATPTVRPSGVGVP
jgi:hypothetical protein